MNAVRKYWAIASISAKTNMAYASEVISRLFFLGVIMFIFMRLWQATFANAGAPQLAGLSLNQVLWYIAAAESIILSGPRVAFAVDQDVRTGAVCTQLTRPMSYPLFRFFSYLGERAVRFIATATASATIAWLLVGPPELGASGLPAFLLTVPFAFALDFCGAFTVGLGAFWMEDTTGLNLIYSRLVMILGGMIVPVQFFPKLWRTVLDALPFASIVNGPARLFVHYDGSFLLSVLTHQAVWLLLFSAAVCLVYSKAVSRIAANGG